MNFVLRVRKNFLYKHCIIFETKIFCNPQNVIVTPPLRLVNLFTDKAITWQIIYLFISGNCILRVWHHGSALHPCKCPICRRLITLIIPSDASVQDYNDPLVIETLQNVERYNRLFSIGGSSLTQVILAHLLSLWEFSLVI